MRGDVGSLGFSYSEKANLAYQTYASLYLDYVDDNYSHFTWRGHDMQAFKDLENLGFTPDNELLYLAYMNLACDIAKYSGENLDTLFRDYPELINFSSRLNNRDVLLMAKEAFRLIDHINGTLSGGIEAMRDMKLAWGEGTTVNINWCYPATGGLSDRIYHYTDPVTVHTDQFAIENDILEYNGERFGLDPDLPMQDLVKPEMYKFLIKWGLKNSLVRP